MLLPMKSSSKTVCTGIPAELRRDLNSSACFAMHSTFLDGAHHRCIEVGLTSAACTALHERGGAGPCSGYGHVRVELVRANAISGCTISTLAFDLGPGKPA